MSDQDRTTSLLEVRDLHQRYRDGARDVDVLAGVELDVKPGEFLAVMGPSGCGKSTLLFCLGGLARPSAGSIRLEGVDLAALSDRDLTAARRDHIGFVFQRFNLIPTLTARGNVEIALQIRRMSWRDGTVDELLGRFGLGEKTGRRPRQLSHGEQQRLAVARAIAGRPMLLLADEPTGSLDSENTRSVMEMLRRLCDEDGQTTVMVTHSREVAAIADRILEMRDGLIIPAARGSQ